jgi:hypothetical protein
MASLDYAAKWMSQLVKKYGNYRDALSVYNSGRPWEQGQGISETRNYVGRILSGKGGGDASAPSSAITSHPAVQAITGPSFKTVIANQLLQQAQSLADGEAPDAGSLIGLAISRKQLEAAQQAFGPEPAKGSLTAPLKGEPTGDPGGMVPDFSRRLEQMVAASGGRLQINSGYRSTQHQAQLFAAAVKKYGSEAAARKWVAPPGKSRHNHGMAADLGGDLSWAHANAGRFGLTFPMSWEPWHVELQGAR